ncbi:KdsC family phosphatase [Aureibacter tunicatorum]|uniref:YrbI family 3-deoxy-D-manno-octulosonate 8-phosphate phosphatase n=1 Tax=Aureibacter tunicatorum TaxID=866807 RepID=A0AAE3XN00_9BACT|nr:HAD-IIIA family hydrolase [Aureibacter tunicatorum]MDR6240906.1 YrbI family 3-deoxy-D-manno-octulosonate 8-phosphate phosphatase [Aureibacter tunicatorum]BDD03686.1 hypothetical protein AUTU_11690 [Aureibacter tunicatorum]
MSRYPNIKIVITDVDGTLTDGGLYISESGEEFKKFNAKDGMGMHLLMKNGIKVAMLSHSRSSKMIHKRAQNLGLDFCYVGKTPKMEIIQEWLDQTGLTMENVAYMGDDVNDLEAISASGLGACPSDACDEVLKAADVVLNRKGGEAAFRELVDEYLLN